MRVDGQAVMLVFLDSVMVFPALPHGIDVDRDTPQMRHVVEQLVADLSGKIMAFGNGQTPRHRDAEIRVQAVADPPRAHVGHLGDAGNMAGRVRDSLEGAGFHAVQHSDDDRARRLPD